jgi:hypothetical protein
MRRLGMGAGEPRRGRQALPKRYHNLPDEANVNDDRLTRFSARLLRITVNLFAAAILLPADEITCHVRRLP